MLAYLTKILKQQETIMKFQEEFDFQDIESLLRYSERQSEMTSVYKQSEKNFKQWEKLILQNHTFSIPTVT